MQIDGRWFNADGSIDTSGIASSFIPRKAFWTQSFGQFPGEGGGGGTSAQALIDKAFALVGNWYNTGYGFENGDNISLGYDGPYISLNTTLDGYINIPEITLTGNSSDWGNQIQTQFNNFMNDTFSWVQNHPREMTSLAGMIEGSSQLVAKGLKNWNAPSSITKSRIFAEVISTRLPASAQALGKYSTVLKWGGRAVGAIGVANSLYQGYKGNISKSRATLDTVMGVVGFMGPWGAAASLIYFGGMAIYETYYNDGKPAF